MSVKDLLHQVLAGAKAAAMPAAVPGMVGSAMPAPAPGMGVGMGMGMGMGAPAGVPGMPVPTPDTKPARELYIGGIPSGMTGTQLQLALGQMVLAGGAARAPGNPIIRVWMSPDSSYAFVEFRSVDETNAALVLLDGQALGGTILKIGRPKSWHNSSWALSGAPAGSYNAGPGGTATAGTAAAQPTPIAGLAGMGAGAMGMMGMGAMGMGAMGMGAMGMGVGMGPAGMGAMGLTPVSAAATAAAAPALPSAAAPTATPAAAAAGADAVAPTTTTAGTAGAATVASSPATAAGAPSGIADLPPDTSLPPGFKIVVANVPVSMGLTALLAFMRAFGTVRSCEMAKHPKTGAFKGYAVVEYTVESDADTAVKTIPAVPVGTVVLKAKWAYESQELLGPKSTWIELTNIAVLDEVRAVFCGSTSGGGGGSFVCSWRSSQGGTACPHSCRSRSAFSNINFAPF